MDIRKQGNWMVNRSKILNKTIGANIIGASDSFSVNYIALNVGRLLDYNFHMIDATDDPESVFKIGSVSMYYSLSMLLNFMLEPHMFCRFNIETDDFANYLHHDINSMYLPWNILTKISIKEQEAVVSHFIQQCGYCLYKAIQRPYTHIREWELFENYMATNYGPLLFRCDLSGNDIKKVPKIIHHDDVIMYRLNTVAKGKDLSKRATCQHIAFRSGISAFRKARFIGDDMDPYKVPIHEYIQSINQEIPNNRDVYLPGVDHRGNQNKDSVPVHSLYVMHGGNNDDPLSDDETDMIEQSVNEQQSTKPNTKLNMLLNDDSSTEIDYKEIVKYILFTFVLACIVICIVKVVKSIHEEHRVIEKYSPKKRSCNRKSTKKSVKHLA